MDLLQTLKTIRRHKLLFLAVSLLSLLAVLLFPRRIVTQAVVYTARAKILIAASSINQGVSEQSVVPGGSLRVWFADRVTLQELVTSEALIKRVLEKLESQDEWTAFRSRIQVEPLSEQDNAAIYILSVSGTTPTDSQKGAEALSTEFVEYVQELSSKEFASTRKYLEELLSTADLRIQKTEASLEKLRQTLPSDEEVTVLARQRLELEAENQQLKTESNNLREESGRLQAFVNGTSSVPPWTILQQNSPGFSGLSENLAKEKSQLIELKKTYTDSNLLVQEQSRRVADQEKLYLQQVIQVAQSLLADKIGQLAAKEAQLKSNQAMMKTLVDRRIPEAERLKLERLRRQLEMYQESYLQLVKQLNEARVAELTARRQGAISILERPLAGSPSGGGGAPDHRLRDLALAIPLCLILGVGATLLADYFSSSMRIIPRIEETMEVPVLIAIPQLPNEMVERWAEMKQEAYTRPPRSTEGS